MGTPRWRRVQRQRRRADGGEATSFLVGNITLAGLSVMSPVHGGMAGPAAMAETPRAGQVDATFGLGSAAIGGTITVATTTIMPTAMAAAATEYSQLRGNGEPAARVQGRDQLHRELLAAFEERSGDTDGSGHRLHRRKWRRRRLPALAETVDRAAMRWAAPSNRDGQSGTLRARRRRDLHTILINSSASGGKGGNGASLTAHQRRRR